MESRYMSDKSVPHRKEGSPLVFVVSCRFVDTATRVFVVPPLAIQVDAVVEMESFPCPCDRVLM
jgi:hypothetical protein